MACIEDLPNEIINRIFDQLDTSSIIAFSLTCQRYLSCGENYQQYQVNFESMSKDRFDAICRLLKPSNIQSLTLSDDPRTPGQIQLFLKNVQITQLNRLKSLTLIEIAENDLDNLLKNLVNNSLSSLRIEYRQYSAFLNSSTIANLQKMLSLKTLKRVYLDMRCSQGDAFQWPSSSSAAVSHLTLVNLHFDQFLRMVERANRFQSIVLKDLTMKGSKPFAAKSIRLEQLKSFEIGQSELILDEIQSLIAVMNGLVHLKLEGSTNSIGKICGDDQLEHFFQTKLKNIQSFQFFLQFSPIGFSRNSSIIESFLGQFRKPFWISHLNCFVSADSIGNGREVHFYSIPPLIQQFNYSDQFNLTSFSTSPSSNDRNQRFDCVEHLELDLKDLSIKSEERKCRLFPQLKSLKLTMSDQCSIDCLEFLGKSIDVKKLVKVVLIICSRGEYLHSMLNNFLDFLKEMASLQSLEIFNRWHGLFAFIDINSFSSMIPISVKHLSIDISDINHINILIQQLRQVSSFQLKFSFEKSLFVKDILQWLTNQRINATYISDIHYLATWISQ